MWGEFCEVFSPNAEKMDNKPNDAVKKYTTIALVKFTLKKILRKK